MPIGLDTLPSASPTPLALPGSVTVRLTMHSTGNADTSARITYSIDPGNDVFFATSTKAVTIGPFPVPVAPGRTNNDVLGLVRGPGTHVTLVFIDMDVQEVDAAGTPVGVPQPRSVMIQVP
jgi:hypothetical protein